MNKSVVFVFEAVNDIQEAYQWYEAQRQGLGNEYLKAVEECLDHIALMPEVYERKYKNFRRGIVRRFPYLIFYEVEQHNIVVYGVFHSSQNPVKWKRRVR